jgi:hypothetical protein
MSARNDSRCSADSSCQRARKVTAQPITEALGALGGVPLGGVCADVLDCGRELAGELGDQLDFVLAEAVRLFPGDGEDPERLTAERERGHHARLETELGELLFLRVARLVRHVSTHDRLPASEHVFDHGADHGTRDPAREEAVSTAAGIPHDHGLVTLDEDDREAVELEDAPHLAEEPFESLVLFERRSERPGHPVHRLELVAASAEAVAQLLEEDLPDRRVRLVGVVEDDIGSNDPGVEAECREAQDLLCAQVEFRPREKPEAGGPDHQQAVMIHAHLS